MTLYAYTVDVGTLSGFVEADDRDEALAVALNDALRVVPKRVLDGTWTVRELDE